MLRLLQKKILLKGTGHPRSILVDSLYPETDMINVFYFSDFYLMADFPVRQQDGHTMCTHAM